MRQRERRQVNARDSLCQIQKRGFPLKLFLLDCFAVAGDLVEKVLHAALMRLRNVRLILLSWSFVSGVVTESM